MDRLGKFTSARSKSTNRRLQNEIQLVTASGLFDATFYSEESGQRGSQESLISHFITHGDALGASPSQQFDVRFYQEAYADVRNSDLNSLVHYIRHGQSEARYPTARALTEDAAELSVHSLFDADRHIARFGLQRLPAIEDYLLNWRKGRTANSKFDDVFYEKAYHATERTGRPPIFDFISRRDQEVLFTTSRAFKDAIEAIIKDFDDEFYKHQLLDRDISLEDDFIRHYLLNGINNGLMPSTLFSPDLYRQFYSDIARHDIEPFGHYLLHGRSEGRVGQLAFHSLFRAGGHRYVPGLGTLLIANHDSSRTGAPLVGLNLARSLLDRWNVFAFVGREEALLEEFRENSTGLIVGWRGEAEMSAIIGEAKRLYGLDAVIVNSVEASGIVHAAARNGVAVVALIHEFADYTAPFGRTADAVRLADRVVVPAALVERSLQTEVEFVCGAQAPNIVVRPQGLLPFLPESEDDQQSMSRDDIQAFVAERSAGHRHIVLGAGYIGQRKGVDLFVQTAAEVARQRSDIAFLWVGDGYAPRTDMHYSIWVEQMIQRMGLEKLVHFLPSQKNLDAAFEVCDLFYLPSRLDPFPNVVVDAFNAGRAVVCFEGATGCAELLSGKGVLPGAAVPYCDITAAAQAIISMIDARAVGGEDVPDDAPAPATRQLFDFDTYVAGIECEIEQARASAAATDAAARRIVQAGAMDAVFYEGRRVTDILGATRDYVASSRKGLARRNPRPGFSDNLWHGAGNASAGCCALDAALEVQAGAGALPRTHVCHRVGSGNLTMPNSGRAALHVHFHYADLAAEFTRRLSASRAELDIFATVTSQNGFRQVEYALMSYRGGTVQTLLVPNRGRDIGPLLVDLADKLDGYDIIGHLHAKRSLVIGRSAGDQWRDFLLDTLLGDHNGVLADILRLFTNDPNLGLVFPEDPHNVGWTANRASAEQLAQRMSPVPILPQRPIFPIGTMFWARSAVLQPFWNLHLSRDDLPVEPLAYDGTILHSIERMFPAVCQAQNLAWATIHNPMVKR